MSSRRNRYPTSSSSIISATPNLNEPLAEPTVSQIFHAQSFPVDDAATGTCQNSVFFPVFQQPVTETDSQRANEQHMLSTTASLLQQSFYTSPTNEQQSGFDSVENCKTPSTYVTEQFEQSNNVENMDYFRQEFPIQNAEQSTFASLSNEQMQIANQSISQNLVQNAEQDVFSTQIVEQASISNSFPEQTAFPERNIEQLSYESQPTGFIQFNNPDLFSVNKQDEPMFFSQYNSQNIADMSLPSSYFSNPEQHQIASYIPISDTSNLIQPHETNFGESSNFTHFQPFSSNSAIDNSQLASQQFVSNQQFEPQPTLPPTDSVFPKSNLVGSDFTNQQEINYTSFPNEFSQNVSNVTVDKLSYQFQNQPFFNEQSSAVKVQQPLLSCPNCFSKNDNQVNFCSQCGFSFKHHAHITPPHISSPHVTTEIQNLYENSLQSQVQNSIQQPLSYPSQSLSLLTKNDNIDSNLIAPLARRKSIAIFCPGGKLISMTSQNQLAATILKLTLVNSKFFSYFTCLEQNKRMKEGKKLLKSLIESKDLHEFEASYLFHILESKECALSLFQSSSTPSSWPDPNFQQTIPEPHQVDLSLAVKSYLENNNLSPLLDASIQNSNFALALSTSWLLGNQSDFMYCLSLFLQNYPPSGMLRVLLGLSMSDTQSNLLDPATVCNWWKEITAQLLLNSSKTNQLIFDHIYQILLYNNLIAASIFYILFSANLSFSKPFFSAASSPMSLSFLSFENHFINDFYEITNDTVSQNAEIGKEKLFLFYSLIDSGMFQDALNLYTNSHLNNLSYRANSFFHLFSPEFQKTADSSLSWKAKLPNLSNFMMNVVDRVIIGEDENLEHSSKALNVLSSVVEKQAPFSVVPPFNSVVESQLNAQEIPPVIDYNIQGSTQIDTCKESSIQPAELLQPSILHKTSLSSLTHQESFYQESICQQSSAVSSTSSSNQIASSENENFHSPILKAVESPVTAATTLYSVASSNEYSSSVSTESVTTVDGSQSESESKTKTSSSYFGTFFRSMFKAKQPKESQGAIPIQANLGEENTFVYDPVLKTWRDTKDPAPPEPESATPPLSFAGPPPLSTTPLKPQASNSQKGPKSRYVEIL